MSTTDTPDLRSPYPYFGGKSRVAELVWSRFGNVQNFVEPFFGSGAVLLARPQPFNGTETVNDLNAWLANFWRALQHDPEAVARWADYPVSELDLHARGDAIFFRDDWYAAQGLGSVEQWVEWIRGDPDRYNAKIAGYWVWGQSSWIGDNWGRPTQTGRGLIARPHLGGAGMGVNRQRPHLGDAGMGVNRQQELTVYLAGLAERTRRVRVCCGDWSRVCGPCVTVKHGITGAFLDPPYGDVGRDECYGEHEDFTVAAKVRQWCIEWQDDPRMRIALCGYDGEHELPGWECVAWKAHGGYANARKNGTNENAKRERIWFSPHCLKTASHKQRNLFDC